VVHQVRADEARAAGNQGSSLGHRRFVLRLLIHGRPKKLAYPMAESGQSDQVASDAPAAAAGRDRP
jgi:hypothetical protein